MVDENRELLSCNLKWHNYEEECFLQMSSFHFGWFSGSSQTISWRGQGESVESLFNHWTSGRYQQSRDSGSSGRETDTGSPGIWIFNIGSGSGSMASKLMAGTGWRLESGREKFLQLGRPGIETPKARGERNPYNCRRMRTGSIFGCERCTEYGCKRSGLEVAGTIMELYGYLMAIKPDQSSVRSFFTNGGTRNRIEILPY